MRFNDKADAYLNELYDSVGAKTWEQKFETLKLKLRIDKGTQRFSHNPSFEQKVAMLEYDLLEHEGLIELELW